MWLTDLLIYPRGVLHETPATALTAGLLAFSFAATANAVPSKASRTALANIKGLAKAQAAKKFSAIHFIKRRNFVNDCMGFPRQGYQGAPRKDGKGA